MALVPSKAGGVAAQPAIPHLYQHFVPCNKMTGHLDIHPDDLPDVMYLWKRSDTSLTQMPNASVESYLRGLQHVMLK